MTNAETKPLNKVEVWVAEHAVPIFGAIALLIVIGALAVFVTYQKQNAVAERVKVLSPQVTRVNQAICDKRSLESESRARRCAARIRVGLVNCRRVDRCRAAFLAVLTYPPPARSTAPSGTTLEPEGGGAQQPSNSGHQQPGPGEQPGHGQGGGNDHGQEASPAPSPSASGPPAAEHGPPAESPGNGAQGSQGGESSSGADVEVCALERCVGAEVDVNPKGLLP